MEDEHWPDSSAATFEGECERCGERRPLQLVVDPFVREGIVDGPPDEQAWCRPCTEARADDV